MIAKAGIPAVAYYRMSSDKQTESIPSQREAVERYAAENGYDIIREYSDSGIAGWKSEERAGFQQVIADAASGDFATVICWDIDRFSRFPVLEANHYWYLLDRENVSIATVNQGLLNFSDLGSWLLASVTQHGKAEYVRDLSRNVTRGLIRNAKAGKSCGGPANYGYRWQDGYRVVDEDAAEVVRQIFEMYAGGHSLRGIGKILSDAGMTSPKGGVWSPASMRQILKHRVYLGESIWNRRREGKYHRVIGGVITPTSRTDDYGINSNDESDLIVVKDAHPAIIDVETFDKAQGRFSLNKHQTQKRIWPLSGLLYCSDCGGSMGGRFVRKTTGGKSYDYRYYLCNSFGSKGKAACYCNKAHEAPLIGCIIGKVQEQFLNPDNIKRLEEELRRQLAGREVGQKKDTDRRQKQFDELDAKIDKAKRRLVEVDSDMLTVVQEHLRELLSKRDAMEGETNAVGRPQAKRNAKADETVEQAIGVLWSLHERLQTTDQHQLRELMRELIDRIDLSFEHEQLKTYTRNRFVRGVISFRDGSHSFRSCSERLGFAAD
jgi:site-specific DNA recombinase